MRCVLRAAITCGLLAVGVANAYAIDPVLMLLFNAASQMIGSGAETASARPETPAPEPTATYPGTPVRPDELRQLIDACFGYLDTPQRQQIFESLNRELLQPKNAAIRGALIQYFADRALQVRAAQRRLSELSDSEKQALATQFAAEAGTLPPQELAQFRTLLKKRLLPVPPDLNGMLLAAIDKRAPREAAAAARAAPVQ